MKYYWIGNQWIDEISALQSDELTEKCAPHSEDKLRGKCSADQFQCKTGECIPIDNLCDGSKGKTQLQIQINELNVCIEFYFFFFFFVFKSECQDSSDETVEYCASKCCPPFGFRCGYGACVDVKSKCDGNADCLGKTHPHNLKYSANSDINHEQFDRIQTNRMRIICYAAIQKADDHSQQQLQRPLNGQRLIQTKSTSIIRLITLRQVCFACMILNATRYKCVVFVIIGACRITKVPRNGWIEYSSPPYDKLSPGEIVNGFTTVNYKCLVNHLIEGPTANFCINGAWRSPIPDCQPRCSTKAITGVSIVATSCFLNDAEVRCSDPAQPGTYARVNCRDRYVRQSGSKQQIITCGDDGVWAPLPDVCSPICGEEAPEGMRVHAIPSCSIWYLKYFNIVTIGTPYVVGGFHASINEVPWHVGIYKFNGGGYSLQCGGTIINARVIVSAMHCKFYTWKWNYGRFFAVCA